jgi:hypothetical protein
VVRLPSALAMTTGSLPSMTETHELVVPRSIPIIFPIFILIFDTTVCQGLCQQQKEQNL